MTDGASFSAVKLVKLSPRTESFSFRSLKLREDSASEYCFGMQLSSASYDQPGTKAKPRPGDANLDGKVDDTDFKIWQSNCFRKGCWKDGDFNNDGLVDGSDFIIWNQYKFS